MIATLIDRIVRRLRCRFAPEAELAARRDSIELYELARWEQEIRAEERGRVLRAHTCQHDTASGAPPRPRSIPGKAHP